MSRAKTPKKALAKGGSVQPPGAWQGTLVDEVIVVTRLEVEARQDYEPNAEDRPPELRRWLRIGEIQARGRTWLLDFEVASPPDGSPYRFLAHLFATINDGDPEAVTDEVASVIMNRLAGRLYCVAGEQLFAATVRGPWGPISLPPQGPSPGLARRMKDDILDSAQAILELLAEEGQIPKTELADRIGADFEQAFKVVLIQGLVEEEGSQVRLRRVV